MLGAPRIVPVDGVDLQVAAHGDHSVLSITATRRLAGLATGRFSRPAGGVRWDRHALACDIEFLGFGATQFALPMTASADLDFETCPQPGVRSPRAVMPLLARSGDEVRLLAPISGVHEQVITWDDDGLGWGWHGDLDEVPGGFESRLVVYRAASVSDALAAWREDLAPTATRTDGGALNSTLSYWTDNGAAYWYRTEPGRTIAESVVAKVRELDTLGIPVGAVELDSWFYHHETPRPITAVGYPVEVPPTGTTSWSPRSDAFPRVDDPIGHFRHEIGDRPLVLHARHVSPRSDDVGRDGTRWWVDRHAAHPVDPDYFRRWFVDARRWGATCIEQDWMQVVWFGVDELRRRPGRALEWQRHLNELAAEFDVDLLWCMATPADMIVAAGLERVAAIRTCDDYRFAEDAALLWTWFLTVNRLTDLFGVPAFKDCFVSRAALDPGDDVIDGDPHAELEALLAAMSGGPVGLGDRIGRSDVEVVRRTCDADGALRPVDRSLAMVDDCLFGAPASGERLAWATTTATQSDGTRVRYVVAINTADPRRVVSDGFDLGAVHSVYDWRRRRFDSTGRITLDLAPRDWALFVCRAGSGHDWLGDASKYVTNPRSIALPP